LLDGVNFDLFGQPIVDRAAMRGRPAYEATERDRNKVKLLLALGWSNDRIANGVGVSLSTLKRYFRAELKVRGQMRDRLNARRLEIAMDEANKGNVAALKELGRMIETNDRMTIERDLGQPDKPDASDAPQERIGKKVIAEQKAMDADADLMAELEREAQGNARH
jgi:hypothetical protein